MKLIKLTAASLILFTACNNKGGKSVSDGDLKTPEKKASYAIGLAMAKQLKGNIGQISKDDGSLDTNLIYAAFNEYITTGKARLDSADMEKTLMEWQQGLMTKKNASAQKEAGVNKEKGAAYVAAQMAANKNLKKTASGLVYEVIKEGSGAKPTLKSTVKVNYIGKLTDGTVFDESKGQPVEFPLGQVIKGWTEGLQLMTPGSKYRFIIPSDLAYGDAQSSPKIPAGSTLVFEVDLLEAK